MHIGLGSRPVLGLALICLVIAACSDGTAATTSLDTTTIVTAAPTTTAVTTTTTHPPATSTTTSAPSGIFSATVDVDGHRMHIACRGTAADGSPTVVFDGDSSTWLTVQREISVTTRACRYDLAGSGLSDPPIVDVQTSVDEAADLHSLLTGAGVSGPYVFVAWSRFGWISTAFTNLFPEEVAGVVFIDPRGPWVSSKHLAALPQPSTGESAVVTEQRDILLGMQSNPGDDDNRLDWPATETIIQELLDRPGPFFGDRPVIVLSGANTKEQFPDLPQPLLDEFFAIFRADQQRYADESTGGIIRVVEDSYHEIQGDRPDAVVDAILEVLGAIAAQ